LHELTNLLRTVKPQTQNDLNHYVGYRDEPYCIHNASVS
jgi:hypothetical protein